MLPFLDMQALVYLVDLVISIVIIEPPHFGKEHCYVSILRTDTFRKGRNWMSDSFLLPSAICHSASMGMNMSNANHNLIGQMVAGANTHVRHSF